MCLTEEQKKNYREFLEKAVEGGLSEPITNSGKDHAVVLYSVMLKNSCNIVRIFCQTGNSYVWQSAEFKAALTEFLGKSGTELRVLTAEALMLDQQWLDRANVQAIQISDESKEKIYKALKNRSCNFAVFDDSRYRYEYDYKNFKAFGSFNDRETARRLRDIFDEAFDFSQPDDNQYPVAEDESDWSRVQESAEYSPPCATGEADTLLTSENYTK